jgi:hypothetical protein
VHLYSTGGLVLTLGDLKDDMQIEFGDLITEEVKEVVDWLERVARPAVQSTIKDAADVSEPDLSRRLTGGRN